MWVPLQDVCEIVYVLLVFLEPRLKLGDAAPFVYFCYACE